MTFIQANSSDLDETPRSVAFHLGLHCLPKYPFIGVSSTEKRIMYAFEPRHEISNNVVYATSKASDQPAHMRSLIRGFASRLNIL